jgi:hypothetical protein
VLPAVLAGVLALNLGISTIDAAYAPPARADDEVGVCTAAQPVLACKIRVCTAA